MRRKWILSLCLAVCLFGIGAAEDIKLPPGAVVHSLSEGDDWKSVSELFGVPVEALRRSNADIDLARAEWILVPKKRQWPVHKVEEGQTLWRIGKAYNIPVSQLRQANELNDSSLLPGQQLIVPRAAMPPWSLPERVAKQASEPVRRDTLTSRSGIVRPSVPQTSGDWVSVSLPDGRQAWVDRSELILMSPRPQPPTEVVQVAKRFLGVPYKWAGTDPNGYDCSGFVQHVFALSGHVLPRMADVQYENLEKVERSELTEGDLVFFNTDGTGVSHVGLYMGNGSFIHASSSRGVVESRLDQDYYARRYVGGGRLKGLSTGQPQVEEMLNESLAR